MEKLITLEEEGALRERRRGAEAFLEGHPEARRRVDFLVSEGYPRQILLEMIAKRLFRGDVSRET